MKLLCLFQFGNVEYILICGKRNLRNKNLSTKKLNQKVKDNTYSNKSNPYYSINPIADNDTQWRFSKPTIFSEKTTVEGKAKEVIRKSYAALIEQTIVMQSSGSNTGSVSIWHDAPITPNDYGQEGWMAFDGDYHYIYVGGRWLRQSIAEWIN